MLETLLSNRTVSVLWEALPRILSAGLTMTIPLTLISFTLAMVLGGGRGAGAVRPGAGAEPAGPVLHLGHPRHAAAGAAVHHLLWSAQRWASCWTLSRAAVIAFAFNEGAYCAETMRGARRECAVRASWKPATASA